MVGQVARKWELPSDKDVAVPSTPISDSISPAAVLGVCSEVYPDLCIARVKSQALEEERLFPYHPDCPVIPGITVVISIASNVPRITSVISYGADADKVMIMDPDGKGPDDSPFLYVYDEEVPWSEDEAEHIGASPVIIKHEPGEKVYHVNFAGLKIGHESVHLFYKPQARIELSKDLVSIKAVEFIAYSKGGSIRIDKPDGDGSGMIASSVHDVEADEAFEYIHDLKGDISSILSTKKIEIDMSTAPGNVPAVNDMVMLTIILDKDVADYEEQPSLVTHTYQNRELDINNQGTGSGKEIHKDLLSKSESSPESINSRAILCKVHDIDFPITYMKAVTRSGDIYEFTAGEKTSVSSEVSDLVFGKYSGFIFGDYDMSIQDNMKTSHFPTKENTSSFYEFFGTSIRNMKGKSKDTYFQENYVTCINTLTEHEIDTFSGISTRDIKISPIYSAKFQHATLEYDIVQDSGRTDVGTTSVVRKDNDETRMDMSVGANAFSVISSDQEKDSSLRVGSNGAEFKTPASIVMDSKVALYKSDFNQFEGKSIFEDGIHVEGDFIIDAENIFLLAKENIFLQSKVVYTEAKESFIVNYSSNFQVYSSEVVIQDNKTLLNAGIFMQQTQAHFQGERTNVYGQDTITLSAVKFATLASEKTTIAGLSQ